jgi:hypothetical protein
MSYVNVDVYTNDTTLLAAPVAGVVVKVLSVDGRLTYAQSVTDDAGHAGFLLPDSQTYQLRLYKFGVQFTQPQLLSVLPDPAVNAFNVAATLLTPPVPTDARLCTAYGYFRDITGAPQANVDIHFIAKFEPALLEGSAVLKERVRIQTDERGYAQINLIRNGQYNVTIQGEEDVVRTVSVPDTPNVNLPDLIFPVVSAVRTVPTGPFTMRVGDKLDLEMHIIASDGEDLGMAIGDVLVSSTDDTIVNFSRSVGILQLQATAVGTAQIVFKRCNTSIVRIPDLGITGQPISVTVIP